MRSSRPRQRTARVLSALTKAQASRASASAASVISEGIALDRPLALAAAHPTAALSSSTSASAPSAGDPASPESAAAVAASVRSGVAKKSAG